MYNLYDYYLHSLHISKGFSIVWGRTVFEKDLFYAYKICPINFNKIIPLAVWYLLKWKQPECHYLHV